MYDINNIFAKIIRKEIKADIIFEDEEILAFNDIKPTAKTHFLVIPKKSYISYSDFVSNANNEEISSFFKKLHILAKKILGEDAEYKLLTNNGPKAGQIIFHFHCHIISDS